MRQSVWQHRRRLRGVKTSLDNRRYGASELRLPHAKEFLRKLFAVWTRAFRNCSSPVLNRKFKKNIDLKAPETNYPASSAKLLACARRGGGLLKCVHFWPDSGQRPTLLHSYSLQTTVYSSNTSVTTMRHNQNKRQAKTSVYKSPVLIFWNVS
jgi:hypothetical protein